MPAGTIHRRRGAVLRSSLVLVLGIAQAGVARGALYGIDLSSSGPSTQQWGSFLQSSQRISAADAAGARLCLGDGRRRGPCRLRGGGAPVTRTRSVIEKENKENEKPGDSQEVDSGAAPKVPGVVKPGGTYQPIIARRKTRLHALYDIDLGDKGVLGTGTFSTVRVATHKVTGIKYAVKAISLANMQPQTLIRLRREIQVLRSLNHKNIIQLYEIFEEEGTLFMIMELCTGGELWHFLQQVEIFPNGDKFYYSEKGRVELTEAHVAVMIRGIVEAIHYCHQRRVCHRDLKLENLMLANTQNSEEIKLIDFGFSKIFSSDNGMFAILGSPYYVAPEVLRARAPSATSPGSGYGCACDMWSIGVITYMILCGQAPFDGETDQERLAAVRQGVYAYPEHANLSQAAMSFVNGLLTVDPHRRLDAKSALAHPWIRDCQTPPKRTARGIWRMFSGLFSG
mmetsp:Transcript_495/g.1021  ORF Transcript_495/g.1021 Transcript_495/m.1021 type:complete len:454 (-) Transcript_495:194-1555(-)